MALGVAVGRGAKHALGFVLALAGIHSAASAAPQLGPPFSDHVVLQRGVAIPVWGTADRGEKLTITLGSSSARATADRKGEWRADLPPMQAGGPFVLTVAGASGTARADDVVIGDVWLCSGQSNMEYPVRRALNGEGEAQSSADPQLRLMKVPHQLAELPQRNFTNAASWQPATPETVGDFSAACYFMVRELRASRKVPIGAIDDTWGGTPIRAWMDESSARVSGAGELADLAELHRSDPNVATRRFGDQWGAWWRSKSGDAVGKEPWNTSAGLTWKTLPSLGYWDEWGADWKNHIGAIWAERRVDLSATEAKQAATLSLSAVDDVDQTFVNGIAVGGLNDPAHPRSYVIPAGVLKPGENRIVVYVRNDWGPGGFAGPADKFSLTLKDGTSKPLGSDWQYALIPDSISGAPAAPWGSSSGVSTIYNAMVAPLGPSRLAGVAWYQGEADVGQVGYDRRLAAWMTNWRRQFGNPRLPFLIVGLAGWGPVSSKPTESGWAALINEQRAAVQHDPRTALISAIDLGEPDDIHPANKQEVGRRLALAAKSLVYSDPKGMLSPMPLSATLSADTVRVTFSKPLQTLSGDRVLGIELCDAASGTCRYADARAEGNAIVIKPDGQPVSRVRYAWSDYPIVNLYDLDMLPVPVFELPLD
jgi:sialate O-acetylesterase